MSIAVITSLAHLLLQLVTTSPCVCCQKYIQAKKCGSNVNADQWFKITGATTIDTTVSSTTSLPFYFRKSGVTYYVASGNVIGTPGTMASGYTAVSACPTFTGGCGCNPPGAPSQVDILIAGVIGHGCTTNSFGNTYTTTGSSDGIYTAVNDGHCNFHISTTGLVWKQWNDSACATFATATDNNPPVSITYNPGGTERMTLGGGSIIYFCANATGSLDCTDPRSFNNFNSSYGEATPGGCAPISGAQAATSGIITVYPS